MYRVGLDVDIQQGCVGLSEPPEAWASCCIAFLRCLSLTAAPPPPCVCIPRLRVKQIVQYIDLIKSDDIAGSHGDSFTTSKGAQIPWLSATEFGYDAKAGHGTHVAGSAAGAPLNNPAEPVTCEVGKVLSCVGGCIDDDGFVTDDLITTSYAVLTDIDRYCPAFGCDPETNDLCMSDDVSETLTSNAGMAQGAKLSIFDIFFFEVGLADFVGNGLWEPCVEAGCKLHSNSWGGDRECQPGPNDIAYDQFMYEVRPPKSRCGLMSCLIHC